MNWKRLSSCHSWGSSAIDRCNGVAFLCLLLTHFDFIFLKAFLNPMIQYSSWRIFLTYTEKWFVIHRNYTGDTPYHVWADLDNFLARWKNTVLQNISKCKKANKVQFSVWKPNYLPRQAGATILGSLGVSYIGYLWLWVWKIWTTSSPDKEEKIFYSLFEKFSKFRMETSLPSSTRFTKKKTWHPRNPYIGDLWLRVWYDLKTFRPDKEISFYIFVIREIRQFPYENLTTFLSKLYQKNGILDSDTRGISDFDFELIWTLSWTDLTDLFFKIVIRKICKFPHENLTFF